MNCSSLLAEAVDEAVSEAEAVLHRGSEAGAVIIATQAQRKGRTHVHFPNDAAVDGIGGGIGIETEDRGTEAAGVTGEITHRDSSQDMRTHGVARPQVEAIGGSRKHAVLADGGNLFQSKDAKEVEPEFKWNQNDR